MVATCETCRFFYASGPACRRRPPTWMAKATAFGEWGCPAVTPSHWCGEHEPATPAPAAADDYTAAAVRLAEADAAEENADDYDAARAAFVALYRERN